MIIFKNKKVKFLIFILLIFFLFYSCIDVNIRVQVFKTGKVRVKVIYKTLICGLIDDFKYGLIADGFKNIHQWNRGDYCYVSGEKFGDIKKDFNFGELLKAKVIAGKSTGIFKNQYKFEWYIGEYNEEIARNKGLSKTILRQIRFNFIITLPGKITKTTGSIGKNKRTSYFSYSLYSLNKGKKKIMVISEEGRYGSYLSAQSKAAMIIEKKQQKLFEIKSKINEISYKIDKEKRFKRNRKRYFVKANNTLINLMNKFVIIYKNKIGEYPKSKDELLEYLDKEGINIGDIPSPEPSGKYELYYDIDSHKFKLKKLEEDINDE